MKVKLSERIRPNCEAAPRVIEEIEKLENHALALQEQQKMLKEQLTVWKSRAREMQLVAGRWQYLFESAMKFVNYVDDLFEYAYKDMNRWSLRHSIIDRLAILTEQVSKVRRSPFEKKNEK